MWSKVEFCQCSSNTKIDVPGTQWCVCKLWREDDQVPNPEAHLIVWFRFHSPQRSHEWCTCRKLQKSSLIGHAGHSFAALLSLLFFFKWMNWTMIINTLTYTHIFKYTLLFKSLGSIQVIGCIKLIKIKSKEICKKKKISNTFPLNFLFKESWKKKWSHGFHGNMKQHNCF